MRINAARSKINTSPRFLFAFQPSRALCCGQTLLSYITSNAHPLTPIPIAGSHRDKTHRACAIDAIAAQQAALGLARLLGAYGMHTGISQ